MVRFTPITFSLEELSKLWSFLLKIDYVLSTAYVASVVLIETDDAVPGPALPVLSYDIVAQPFALPVISSIANAADPNAAIGDGATIVLAGTNLAAAAPATTQVLVSGVTLTPSAVSPDTASPWPCRPETSPPASRRRRSSSRLQLGSPPVPHPGTGAMSGAASFVLAPTITPGSLNAVAGPAIAFTVTPQVKAGQRVVLQLIPQATSAPELFDGGQLAAASSNLTVPTPGLAVGNLFRPRADRRRPQPAGAD